MPSYLVTGASRGLGYGWLVSLASNPSNTVLGLVRNKAATEDRLAKDGIKNVHLLAADITDPKALAAAADEAAKVTGGGLDVLIHNAAYIAEQSAYLNVTDVATEDFVAELNACWEANVIGTVYVLDSFLPLIRKGELKKVNVTSTGMADWDLINKYSLGIATPYAVSKTAAVALVSKYHAALGESEGILFFSMSPGFVDTREGKPFSEEELKGMQAMGAKFAAYAPDFKGPISVQESVEAQLKVIERATVGTFGGALVSHKGDKEWL